MHHKRIHEKNERECVRKRKFLVGNDMPVVTKGAVKQKSGQKNASTWSPNLSLQGLGGLKEGSSNKLPPCGHKASVAPLCGRLGRLWGFGDGVGKPGDTARAQMPQDDSTRSVDMEFKVPHPPVPPKGPPSKGHPGGVWGHMVAPGCGRMPTQPLWPTP